MSDEFHHQLLVEARADGAALHELGQHLGALHGAMANAGRIDMHGLHQAFAELHDEFEVLHHQDMEHKLDRRAHRSWRARIMHLAARVDELAGQSIRTDTLDSAVDPEDAPDRPR